MFGLKVNKMSNFQPLEVVGRGSETQPQVVENFNKFTHQDEGQSIRIPLNFEIFLLLIWSNSKLDWLSLPTILTLFC